MKTSELLELLDRATKGPWGYLETKSNGVIQRDLYAVRNGVKMALPLHSDMSDILGQSKAQAAHANAVLCSSAPSLAAEVLRLRELLADILDEHGGDRCDCFACKNAEEHLAETED